MHPKSIGILALIVIFSIILSQQAFAANTGSLAIFDEIGMERPTEWVSWDQTQRHAYLKSLGIYPGPNGHYEGDAGDLTLYFEMLGVEQPSDWSSMSVNERRAFVDNILNPAPEPDPYQELKQDENVDPGLIPDLRGAPLPRPPEKKPFILFIPTVLGLIAVLVSFTSRSLPFRKYVRWLIYYLLPLILIVMSIQYTNKPFFMDVGLIAERLLTFIVFIHPVSLILGWNFLKKPLSYRRELGIASFWFFIVHAGGLTYVKDLWSISQFGTPILLWGLIAGFSMLILTATSNNASLRILKGNWKRVQYLAYIAYLGMLAHTGLSADGNLNKLYIYGGIFILLKLLELKGIRFRKPEYVPEAPQESP